MIETRLRQLRLAQGLTQEALVERMHGVVTKQALSKYEKGKSAPRPTTLIALAAALGVKAADLLRESDYRIDCLQYRTRAPMPPRTKERVESALTARLEQSLRLEDRLFADRRPRLAAKRRPVASLDQAEEAAGALRDSWDMGDEPPANLTEVLERNSIHVFEIHGEDEFDGLAAVAYDAEGEIRAIGIAENPDTKGDRQRFNLAHELGHVVLDASADLAEEEVANRFAGAFLVPAKLVFAEVGARRTEISWDELLLLKGHWKVSIQSILHRLRDLDVISEAHYRWWRTEIRALGYGKTEPMELEREASTWTERQLARAEAEGLISREQAAVYAPTEPGQPERAALDRRALLRLSVEDRRAVLRAHAERLTAEYEGGRDEDWLEADLGEPE